MREISKEELEKILTNHLYWIKEDCEGWENMKANLCEVDLCGANLCAANLRGANLRGANLQGANLCTASLYGANLYGADLCHAHLCVADLCHANLRGADLFKADLCGVNLCEASLCNANLYKADLRGANLHKANLHGANLYGSDLRNTDLGEAKNIPYIPMACPDSGGFIAWKKASEYIVKLYVPSDARRCSAVGRKCRCDKATVIGIENIDGTTADITEVPSNYDSSFKYVLHGHVAIDNFCENRWKECSEGIHFFINREEAVNYGLI